MEKKFSTSFKSDNYTYRLVIDTRKSILNPSASYEVIIVERDFKNDGNFKEVKNWILEDIKGVNELAVTFDWIIKIPIEAWTSLGL